MSGKHAARITEEGDTLKLLKEDGKTTEYGEPIGMLCVTAQSLTVIKSGMSVSLLGMTEEPLKLERRIIGVGTFGKDRVSVIGDEANKSGSVRITISATSAESREKAAESVRKERLNAPDDPKHFVADARLSYVDVSDELDVGESDWFLELFVQQETFNELASAIVNKQITNFSAGVDLKKGAYSSSREIYRHFSLGTCFYLRPRTKDGDVTKPLPAFGTINMWSVKEAVVNFAPETEPHGLGNLDEQRTLSHDEKTLVAVDRTNSAILELGAKINRSVWLLIVALFVLAMLKK